MSIGTAQITHAILSLMAFTAIFYGMTHTGSAFAQTISSSVDNATLVLPATAADQGTPVNEVAGLPDATIAADVQPCMARAQKNIQNIKNNTATISSDTLNLATNAQDAFQMATRPTKIANNLVPDATDCVPKAQPAPPKPRWRQMTAHWWNICKDANIDCHGVQRYRKAENPGQIFHTEHKVW